jgi:hypothetical protein
MRCACLSGKGLAVGQVWRWAKFGGGPHVMTRPVAASRSGRGAISAPPERRAARARRASRSRTNADHKFCGHRGSCGRGNAQRRLYIAAVLLCRRGAGLRERNLTQEQAKPAPCWAASERRRVAVKSTACPSCASSSITAARSLVFKASSIPKERVPRGGGAHDKQPRRLEPEEIAAQPIKRARLEASEILCTQITGPARGTSVESARAKPLAAPLWKGATGASSCSSPRPRPPLSAASGAPIERDCLEPSSS